MTEIVYESRGKLIGGSLSSGRTVKSRPSGTRVVTLPMSLTWTTVAEMALFVIRCKSI